MTRKEFYKILEQIVIQNTQFAKEIEELAILVRESRADPSNDTAVQKYLEGHPSVAELIRKHLDPCYQNDEKKFRVHKPYSKEIRERMKLAEYDRNYRNWANAVKALPEYTRTVPDVDGEFIRKGREIWKQNIYGNEDIFQVILRHVIEYSRRGKTTPILLIGEPGAGKTLVAKNYSKILNLPGSFISGPSASVGRGLSGAPNLYSGAGVGVIVQSMIDCGIGNPVICIDEIEKTAGQHSGSPGFQNELLAMLDESNEVWYDNFLEFTVDASHIPFIFTANDENMISSPLLDRMEVIEMPPPTHEMIYSITKEFTLPVTLKAYDSNRIDFDEHELNLLVNLLWDNGNRSCRAYKKAVEFLVSNAYLDAIENNHTVRITEKNIQNAINICSHSKTARSIGFST